MEAGDGEESGGGVEEARGGAVRVLVVDDSNVDRKIVERLLLRSGSGLFEVVAVDSGKKALEILGLDEKEKKETHLIDDKKIDIILTDYCMPEMNGYDLLVAVKGNSCVKSIPIVIMSSENDPQRISRCEASGAEEFILKPLKTTDVQKLRRYARSAEAAAAAPKAGTKRKLPLELMADGNGTERRPRLTGVTFARVSSILL